jgi:predicted nuclease of restriction endonuclease-like (RecB) superfamily
VSKIISSDKNYKIWLQELKNRVQSSQIKAALKVNSELLNLYWHLGKEISEKQIASEWGDAVIEQLSKDLTAAFPGMTRPDIF